MSRRASTLGIVIFIVLALLGLACQQGSAPTPTPTAPPYTVEESERIARAYVQQSPTYRFDGIEGTLELVHTGTLRCPWCWEFTYRFQSSHAGYGDRTGQMLAQVVTPHEARIMVQEHKVTHAIMDQRWDMLTQSFVPGSR